MISQNVRETAFPGSTPLTNTILIDLVEYVDDLEAKEQLTACYKDSPWLAELTTSPTPDYVKLQDSFAKDGMQFVATIRNFIDVYRKGVFYVVLRELSEQSLAEFLAAYWALICGRALEQRDAGSAQSVGVERLASQLFDRAAGAYPSAHIKTCAGRIMNREGDASQGAMPPKGSKQ